MGKQPSYLFLSASDWQEKIGAANALAAPCRLCPRACSVNRLKDEKGFCQAPGEMIVSSVFAHHGEEPPLSGSKGSGTVFFSHCTLRCIFCQNYQISHEAEGKSCSWDELAGKMLGLQEQGCHNINLVTSSHFLPWVLLSLQKAAQNGLKIPIVYNCGGYETIETIAILKDVVDIYLPDMKYGAAESAKRLSSAPDYVPVNQAAIRAMFKQVGALTLDADGIACRGLCIRHLVLPHGLAGSMDILRFLKGTFDPADIYISLMAQYFPAYKANEVPEMSRKISADEYEPVRETFIAAGFNGFFQEMPGTDLPFKIDFKKRKDEALLGE
jgi:putative pyruvate formate lyase activating enzyme